MDALQFVAYLELGNMDDFLDDGFLIGIGLTADTKPLLTAWAPAKCSPAADNRTSADISLCQYIGSLMFFRNFLTLQNAGIIDGYVLQVCLLHAERLIDLIFQQDVFVGS